MVLNVRRSRERQARRETEVQQMHSQHVDPAPAAWIELRPILDEALDEMDEPDRNALLLRFFEGQEFRRVGELLGTTENAARMRVQRALERLRENLNRKGILTATGNLTQLLLANSTLTAPATLLAGLMTASATNVSAAATVSSSFSSIGPLKAGILAMKPLLYSTVALIVICPVVFQESRIRHTRDQLQNLEAQIRSMEPLRTDSERLHDLQTAQSELERLRREAVEIERLGREEISLRSELKNAAPEAVAQAQAELKAAEAERNRIIAQTEETELHLHLIMTTKSLGLAARIFANKNKGLLPASFEELQEELSSLDPGVSIEREDVLERCEFYPHIHPEAVSVDEPGLFLFREREPRKRLDSKWERIYGMMDGSAQTVVREKNDFSTWEEQTGGIAGVPAARPSKAKP